VSLRILEEEARRALEGAVGAVAPDIDTAISLITELLVKRGVGGTFRYTVRMLPDGSALVRMRLLSGAKRLEVVVRLATAYRVAAVERVRELP